MKHALALVLLLTLASASALTPNGILNFTKYPDNPVSYNMAPFDNYMMEQSEVIINDTLYTIYRTHTAIGGDEIIAVGNSTTMFNETKNRVQTNISAGYGMGFLLDYPVNGSYLYTASEWFGGKVYLFTTNPPFIKYTPACGGAAITGSLGTNGNGAQNSAFDVDSNGTWHLYVEQGSSKVHYYKGPSLCNLTYQSQVFSQEGNMWFKFVNDTAVILMGSLHSGAWLTDYYRATSTTMNAPVLQRRDITGGCTQSWENVHCASDVYLYSVPAASQIFFPYKYGLTYIGDQEHWGLAYDADNRSFMDVFNFTPIEPTNYSLNITDEFGEGENCDGTNFDCGTSTDLITSLGKHYNVTMTDDMTSTMLCAVFVNESTSYARTCLVRQGFNNQSCDGNFTTVQQGNHSDYFVCSNGLNCGWNGQDFAQFGSPSPTRAFQIDTSLKNSYHVIFIRYTCNATPVTSIQDAERYFRVTDTKGIVCSGDDFESAVQDQFGTNSLGGTRSCSAGSFCDPGLQQNFTMTANMTGNFCTPGCHDALQDGSETGVDYGGAICGNCSPLGKANDEYYAFAAEIQEENQSSPLTGMHPFDIAYCPAGEDTGNAVFGSYFIILLISAVTLLLLSLFVLVPAVIIVVAVVGRFIKRRRSEKKK